MNTVGNDDLASTLTELLQSSPHSNLALVTLLDDYARYHAVLVVLGSLLVLLLTLSSVFFWHRFRKVRRKRPQLTFERKVNATFGVLSGGVGLLMALLVAANATNALNPDAGFSLLAGTLQSSRDRPATARLHETFNAWLQSGSAAVPAPVQASVADRLAWQQPKAIICGVLLVVFVALGVRIWEGLIRRSRRETVWALRERALLGAGSATVPFCLLLMVMLVANTQAAFAPITLTMMYG